MTDATAANERLSTPASAREDGRSTSFFAPGWLTPALFWGIVTVLALGAAAAVLRYGMRQFGGEDGGIIADIAYMGKLGYRAYTEIETTAFPPVYVLFAGWAFRLLGARWASLVTFAAAFSALGLVAQAWLSVRAGFGRLAALVLAGTTMAVTILPLSFMGYNQTTSVLAALYLTAVIGFLLKPKDPVARAALVATAVALSWGKINVAGLLLVITFVAFLLDRDTRRSGPLLLGCAALASVGLLFLAGADPRDVFASYATAANRVTPGNFHMFFILNDNWEAVTTLRLLVPAVVAGIAGLGVLLTKAWRNRRIDTALVVVALAGIATGFVAMGTNNDHNMVETPVILIGCFVLTQIAGLWESRGWRTLVALGLLVTTIGVATSGLISTVKRSRVYSIGPGQYWQRGALAPVGGPAMMADVQTGPKFRGLVQDVGEVLRLNPALAGPGPTVFFGPRMLVMYPEYGIAPPKRLPTWWGERPDGDPITTARIATLRADDYKLMIFLLHDYTFYPRSLVRLLKTDYDVYDWRLLTIHVRKGATDVRVPPDAVRTN